MFGRRGHFHWYDWLLVGIAAWIVYPDRVVEWLSESCGRVLGWRTLLAVESIGILGMVLAMAVLVPVYPQLLWWHSILYVGVLGLVRVGMWCVSRFFGFEE